MLHFFSKVKKKYWVISHISGWGRDFVRKNIENQEQINFFLLIGQGRLQKSCQQIIFLEWSNTARKMVGGSYNLVEGGARKRFNLTAQECALRPLHGWKQENRSCITIWKRQMTVDTTFINQLKSHHDMGLGPWKKRIAILTTSFIRLDQSEPSQNIA